MLASAVGLPDDRVGLPGRQGVDDNFALADDDDVRDARRSD
jgi:hypothetical protein